MTKDDAVLYKVIKYGKLIKKKERIPHVLSRLNDVEMTLDILSATNIGRYVNRLCGDPDYGREASRIIEKWKEVARQSGVRGGEDDGSSDGEETHEHEPSPQRVGLLNGVHEVEARNRDDDYKKRHHQRDKNDSELRSREYRRPTDDRKRDHSEVTRAESVSSKSHSDSHRQNDVARRRHQDEDGGRKRSREDSKTSDVDHHKNRHRDGKERKRKREAEEEASHKRKSRNVVQSAGSDEDGYSDKKNFESDNSLASEPDSRGKHKESSEEPRDEGEISERSDDEERGGIQGGKSPSSTSERQSSSRVDKPQNKSPSSEERAHKVSSCSTAKSSHSSSGSKSGKAKVVTDFDLILQSADMSKTKSRKTRDPHWKWTEMPLLNNYQPFPQATRVVKEAAPPPPEDFNPDNMFKPRNERGKVFAGRRKVVAMSLPSLFNLCLRVLSNNVRVLYYAEYINYDVLKPVLEKCDTETLAHIESKHNYLEEDTGELWQRFVSKKYPGEEPENGDSWKDLYNFLEVESEKKLKQLSQRIGKHHQSESQKGHRKVLLADATAPSYIKRRQIQHGTATTKPLPSAIEVSSARRKIFETGGCKDALAALPKAVVNKSSTLGAKLYTGGSKKAPAKKGALMIKTMKMLNMKRK